MTINIPLRPNFQIVFSARNVVDFLRKENILRFYRKTMIGERIMNFLHADGGMLLLCGRMGVGKTSFINEMLADLKLDKHFIVLDIKLNVCRPIDTTQLLYRLIRKTYHASKDIKSDQTEILRKMYIRTLCNSIKAVESSEKTKVMELAVSSKISELLSGKLSSKQEEKTITILEETFAEYDEYTAEEDLISILGQIQNERNQEWLGRRVTKRMSNLMEEIVSDLSRFILGDRRKLRILFIVDELDKLEAEGCDHIINILKSMKELFSSTSSKFILISGRTTYTQADDYLVQEFENIYKGVVADIIYLPCVWDESKLICDQIFDISKMDDGTSKWYEKVFKEYLIYASRGNIRGIFRLINKYKHKSHIEIPPEEKERIHAYAEIQSALMMKVFPETYSWADEFRDDYILEVYRILDIVLRLNPDDLISVDGNTLTCYGKQYGWLTEPFTTKYGVEVNTLFMMLVNQGFMRKTSEPNSISKKEKKAKEVVYLVTDKVLILRHGLIVIDSADFEPGLSVAVSVGTTNLNSLQPIPCSYCLSPILGGEEIITCPSCQSVYHVTCWTFNGGCSVLGCQKNPLLN